MAGLPFGAAQMRTPPAEFATYEHVVGIEFIEIDPDVPYPRSAAYRPTESGGQMRIRRQTPEIEELELDEAEARAYIDGLANAGLFSLNRVYRPAQGSFVVAGVEWRLEVRFDKPFDGKRADSFKVEGENVFPDSYEQLVALLLRS